MCITCFVLPRGDFLFCYTQYIIECSGCLYVRTSVDQVKIFVQGSISRPINGSKLIFNLRMYLYETSKNIQELHDLYFTVH